MRGMNLLKILFITLILAIGLCFTVEALTLKEAISLAKKAYPPLKEKFIYTNKTVFFIKPVLTLISLHFLLTFLTKEPLSPL